MKVIVPLAGPDFVKPDGSVKAEIPVEGLPLLRRALESRSWWTRGLVSDADLVFVLHDNPHSRRFAENTLSQWYPAARQVFLSAYTRGAALTAATGCALLPDMHEPICLDLADILFDCEIDPAALFDRPDTGALALTFPSDKPVYSYLRRNAAGEVIETAEKRVISGEASAGVYFYRSTTVYLKALAHIMDNEAAHTHRNLFFVCPILNGVLPQGLGIEGIPVSNIRDIKVD